jgi:hypothetical protein
MKNLFLLFTISITVLMLAGCKKDQLTEPKVIAPTIVVSSNNSQISYNSSCVLTIVVENVLNVTFELDTLNINEAKKTIQMNTPPLTETTTYHFLATGESGLVDSTNVTIKVVPPAAPTITFTVDNTTITKGESVVFNWLISGLVDSVQSNVSGISGLSGRYTFTPLQSMIATITVYGKGGNVTANVSLTVNDPIPPTEGELLVLAPWKRTYSKWAESMSGPWTYMDLSHPCLEDDRWIFNADHTMMYDQGENLCEGQTIRYWPATWLIEGDYISGFGGRTLVSIDSTSMVWTHNSIKINPDGTTSPIIILEGLTH